MSGNERQCNGKIIVCIVCMYAYISIGLEGVVGKIMVSKDVHVLVLRECVNVLLYVVKGTL